MSFVANTPGPQPVRSWEYAASSAPGKNWTSDLLLEADRSADIAENGITAVILVEDLNPSIPQSDLEQGLHGLFSVFGHVISVVTVSDGQYIELEITLK